MQMEMELNKTYMVPPFWNLQFQKLEKTDMEELISIEIYIIKRPLHSAM